jgi:hypothetical protein
MFGDHIASALARERQRDLVPEMREHERRRSSFGNEDGEAANADALAPAPPPERRARFRFMRAAAGRSQTGERAG